MHLGTPSIFTYIEEYNDGLNANAAQQLEKAVLEDLKPVVLAVVNSQKERDLVGFFKVFPLYTFAAADEQRMVDSRVRRAS